MNSEESVRERHQPRHQRKLGLDPSGPVAAPIDLGSEQAVALDIEAARDRRGIGLPLCVFSDQRCINRYQS